MAPKAVIYHTISDKFTYLPLSNVPEGLETMPLEEMRPNMSIPITEERRRLMGPQVEGCYSTQFDIPRGLMLKRLVGMHKVLYLKDD